MNYFTSCLYGNYDAYMQMKKDVLKHADDRLWVVGDIFDGYDDAPESCIDILNDIAISSNVTLVLGDHEYTRAMESLCSGDAQSAMSWRNMSNNMDISGYALNEYIDKMDADSRQQYIREFLVNECEVTQVVPIGNRYIYLVHGAPRPYSEKALNSWQLGCVKDVPRFQNTEWRSIQTDEIILPHIKNSNNPMSQKNTITISGGTSVEKANREANENVDGCAFYKSGVLALGRDSIDDPIPLIAIDAVSFIMVNTYS